MNDQIDVVGTGLQHLTSQQGYSDVMRRFSGFKNSFKIVSKIKPILLLPNFLILFEISAPRYNRHSIGKQCKPSVDISSLFFNSRNKLD